jgi:DNA-binding CsgD family transcriptional regulator
MIRLTEKQNEAMCLVAKHMTSKEIARELGLSHYAIDQRIRSACIRLGFTNRRGAAKAYLEYLEYLESSSAASS